MPAFIGRKITLTWNGAAIGGVREKGIALNGEPIDISDDDSAGWRQLMEEFGDGENNAAQNEVNVSLSGVSKSDVLMRAWFEKKRTGTVIITYPDGRVISGKFHLATYTETGTYNDATTFEAEVQSSGEAAYAPAP